MKAKKASRREFLKDTTALTASLLAVPALAQQAQQTPPPAAAPPPQEKPPTPAPPPRPEPLVKIGVIGIGGMGHGHCESLVGLHKEGKENVRIVAVCDVYKKRVDSTVEFLSKEQGENGQPFAVQG